MKRYPLIVFTLIALPLLATSCQTEIIIIERPETIVSKREVIYDDATYDKLATLWMEYYDEFPSENAYANWMYAARYAEWPDYESLLEKGVSKYPANPTLLYLKALAKNGRKDISESINLLEKAVELDPSFLDPWFGLAVDYMSIGNTERSRDALENLLKEGAISDEVMDYNYNVISLLEENAILITNGDNDTYPAWILTKILNYRSDVKIINRSLLNTEWYPIHLMKNEAIPEFIEERSLVDFREQIFRNIKNGIKKMPAAGPFSDTLLADIISSAKINDRPIYLAATLYQTEMIKMQKEKGLNLGLVTRISREEANYSDQIKELVNIWLNKFRTGGLESWKLEYGKESAAGKWLSVNYGESLKLLIKPVKKYTPENLLPLFNWYRKYILRILPDAKADEINMEWCKLSNIKVISDWCRKR